MTTMTALKPQPPPPPEDSDERELEAKDPDTLPDTSQDAELLEALEWLKRAGIVSQEGRPAFAGFFEEIVHTSQEGDPEPWRRHRTSTPAPCQAARQAPCHLA